MLDTVDDQPVLSRDWSRWLATNRMLGASDGQLAQIMIAEGVPSAAAWAESARLNADPCFEAGRLIGSRLRKLESILTIQEQLRDLAPSSRKVERRRNVSADDFLINYYAQNRPLVLLDFAHTWAARKWTTDSLQEVLGEETVEVMSGREADERYELNADLHRSAMPFSEYIKRVCLAGRSNDIYLVANNHLLDAPTAARLWEDFDAGSPPLNGATARGNTFLWFGPAGTVTPLHHDVMNVLFVQLYGRKRFTLIAPAFTPRVYNEVGVHANADPEKPNYHAHPEFRGVPTTEVILTPGDTLFLPVGWWHRVEALDVSISLSFTNFAYINEFRWQHPASACVRYS
jgi:ribosomal protein L16 Arg81 hydroxylase